MIVAVITVGMVESAVNDVVDMIAVGNGLVPASWSVDMAIGMGDGMAAVRVGRIDFQRVLVIMIAMLVVHVSVMEKIVVVTMFYFGMAAMLAMFMRMVRVNGTFYFRHNSSLIIR